MENREREEAAKIISEEKIDQLLENRIVDMQGQLAKARLTVRELITDINNAYMPYEEKEQLDTKARIVSDYINQTNLEMEQLLQLVDELW